MKRTDLEIKAVRGMPPPAGWTRLKLLKLQFTKLMNYWPDLTDSAWAGEALTKSGIGPFQRGYSKFLQDTRAYDASLRVPYWITRPDKSLPWGPDNFRLVWEPDLDLGAALEPYLAVNGGIVSLMQAARFLSVDRETLLGIKLRLIFDEAVIAESVKRMLNPRPEWPRIEVKIGRSGPAVHIRPTGQPKTNPGETP